MKYKKELRTALDAVINACRLCRIVQDRLVSKDTYSKKDRSPVTVADFGSQALISHYLNLSFPEIPLVGEEDAKALKLPENSGLKNKVVEYVQMIDSRMDEEMIISAIDRGTYSGGKTGRHWVLDPIDGTKGFLRGEQYAVALALIEDGEVVLGVLGCPNLPVFPTPTNGHHGCLFHAVKDEGTFMRAIDSADPVSPIRVDFIDDPSEAVFCESVESGHSSHSDSASIAKLLNVSVEPVRMDSQCKYAIVARGEASLYLRLPVKKTDKEDSDRYFEKTWDHAAGSVIIEEAGGKVTDIHGKQLDFSIGRTLERNYGVIVTNGLLHEKVLEAVQKVVLG